MSGGIDDGLRRELQENAGRMADALCSPPPPQDGGLATPADRARKIVDRYALQWPEEWRASLAEDIRLAIVEAEAASRRKLFASMAERGERPFCACCGSPLPKSGDAGGQAPTCLRRRRAIEAPGGS